MAGHGHPRTPGAPDRLILGRIATLAGAAGFGWVDAIAITGGRVMAAGPVAAVLPLAGPRTMTWRLGPGRVALPGIVDAAEAVGDQEWLEDDFIPTVAKRGAAIIDARGSSSAASAANAAIDHMHDWALGTNGKWVTMGIPSDGSYGIPEDVIYGVPVTCANGQYTRVTGLEIDEFSRARMDLTLKELFEEREGVKHLLG